MWQCWHAHIAQCQHYSAANLLYIIGNKELLSYDKNWKALIDHYQDKQCIVKGEEFGIVKGNKCGKGTCSIVCQALGGVGREYT